MHLLHQPSHLLKVIVNSSMPMILVTPSQVFLRLSKVKSDVSQLLLHPPEQEIVCRSQIRQVWRVPQGRDLVSGNSNLHYGSGLNRSIFPVEKPFPGHYLWPRLPQLLQEEAQVLHDVDGVDLGALWNYVGIHDPVAIKECHHHLLGSAYMQPCFMVPGFPFSIHSLDCFMSWGCGKRPWFHPL
jgi:hypothetical protein